MRVPVVPPELAAPLEKGAELADPAPEPGRDIMATTALPAAVSGLAWGSAASMALAAAPPAPGQQRPLIRPAMLQVPLSSVAAVASSPAAPPDAASASAAFPAANPALVVTLSTGPELLCQSSEGLADTPLDDRMSSIAMEASASRWEPVAELRRRQRVMQQACSCPWASPGRDGTLGPRNSRRVWEEIKRCALRDGAWEVLERLGMPAGHTAPEQPAALSDDGMQIDGSDAAMNAEASGDIGGAAQAFPVQKVPPNSGQADSHETIAWRVVQDLQSKAAQYGLSSSQVMQVIRVLNTDLLSLFDIKHLGPILFQPVQYSLFEANWRRLAEKAVAGNM
ncbi:uncharacterized protein LOC121675698 [Corvus kubaryi]|uniref:uncharacterized protein LOC121675698 n=1 Tax=Corvus kubaryi TaxID=68294 RepID=UPI001C056B37|nr:uncharacterized protein LOC121675698 [Corvus kubaryi]